MEARPQAPSVPPGRTSDVDRPAPPGGSDSDGAGSSGPSGRRRLSKFLQGQRPSLWVVVIIIGYLALTPVVYLAYGTLFEDGSFTLAGFERAYTTPGILGMVRNSIIFTVGSALLPLILGTFLAYVTVRTDVGFRPLLVAIGVIPLIMPGLLYTIAWILLTSGRIGFISQIAETVVGAPIFNVFSMAGMVWVEGTHNTPLVFLFMLAAFRSMDPSLEESALASGASYSTMLRRVTLPLVRPALAGAFLINAVKSLGAFEVPALLGVPEGIYVFVSRIFFELRDYPYDTQAVGAYSVGLIVLAIIGIYALNKVGGESSQFATVTGRGFRPQVLKLGRAKVWVTAVIILYFVVTTILPFSVMFYNSFLPFTQGFSLSAFGDFSWNNYGQLFDSPIIGRALRNSLFLSVGSATAIMILTAVAAWLVIRGRSRWSQLVDHLAFLPIVIPGLVIGVAVSYVYLRNPLPFDVYGTIWILFIAYIAAFMPYGMRYSVASLQQISVELEESASVSGATWLQTLRRVIVPLMLPGLLAGWVYLIVVSIRELSASILLYSSGSEVLSVVVYEFYEEGETQTVAALGVVMVLALAVLVAGAYYIGNRFGVKQQ